MKHRQPHHKNPMHAEFWHQRWQTQQIGFHEGVTHPLLARHGDRLGTPREAQVLVPLCGKSEDMNYLRARGYRVVGAELSPLAIEAFLSEHELPYTTQAVGRFIRYDATAITLWCGDFFDLTPALLGPVDAVYDRAALIALPAELRTSYAARLKVLAPHATQFLIALEYDAARMEGPPFSVTKAEIQRLYQPHYDLEPVEIRDVHEPRFAQRGLLALHETAYFLQPKQ